MTQRDPGSSTVRFATKAVATLPRPARAVFWLCTIVFLASSFGLLGQIGDRYLVEVPEHGGAISEGVIGWPRYINPILARFDADRDMTALIYSGLMKPLPSGELVPDLAESYTISPDGLVYTIALRPELTWHDGEPITSADIAFTIEKARDPGLAVKSLRRASFDDVGIETPDERTIVFTLKKPFPRFLENLTMGILPKHVWQHVGNDQFDLSYLNLEPIGSGPYMIADLVEDKETRLPTSYELRAFPRYALGEPYITNLTIRLYGNNKDLLAAFEKGEIDQMSAVDPVHAETYRTHNVPIVLGKLPRVYAVFFNQTERPIFADASVREALELAVDRERIVRDVFRGYATPVAGPLPFGATNDPSALAHATATVPDLERARAVLEDGGWKFDEAGQVWTKTDKRKKTTEHLEFSLALLDGIPEFRQTAEILKQNWEALGAKVTLKISEQTVFSTEVVAPRKYDAIFFGEITGRNPDPFAYWHSSQRNAPGSNLALYANRSADKLLEEARKTLDPREQQELLGKFEEEIATDRPAVFLYVPDFIYVVSPKQRKALEVGIVTTESERFLSVHDWYVESERVWKFFSDRMERVAE
ncbi:MAG TPA: ABC transporter substrate-binding protein [Candidatus Paceibacterota bacterium]|nr:ABC transporter substrate-binding protein [Candidatus Paceibacterota bacterium]